MFLDFKGSFLDFFFFFFFFLISAVVDDAGLTLFVLSVCTLRVHKIPKSLVKPGACTVNRFAPQHSEAQYRSGIFYLCNPCRPVHPASPSSPLLSSPLLSSPLSSPPLLSALLVALGFGPGFQSSDGTRVTPINVTWSDEISFLMQPPPPPPLPNQWEATTSNRVQLSHRAS